MSCNQPINDIESLAQNTTNIVTISNNSYDVRHNAHIIPSDESMKPFVADFLVKIKTAPKLTRDILDNFNKKLKQKYRIAPSKPDIRRIYETFFSDIPIHTIFKLWMIKKSMRSTSGVLVATIVLSPHKFSCKYDCFYCPQETDRNGVPTQPRSYLSTEPAMLRALNTRTDKSSYEFDVKSQFQNRIEAYIHMGNINKNDENSHKMEIILSGGTWESYPKEYREQVIHELYYGANTMFDSNPRPMKTLQEEITENETTKYRIIGLTLETRPDNITPESIQDYCRWGATRIQIGVQHFDDAILKKVNRKCYTKDTIRAIRLLKQAGFKVVIHMMPDLPGSSPEKDKWMFEQALTNPDLQFDDVKIYPTAVCKSPDEDRIVYSKIAEWYEQGKYTPYAETNLNDLIDVLMYYKTNIAPWVRIQRLIRDIPGKSIESGYNKVSNLRQVLQEKLKKEGKKCNCIYCMEIGDKELDDLTPIVVVREYKASEGIEYHLSVEAHDFTYYSKFMYYMSIMYSYIIWFFTGKWNHWSGNLDTYSGLYGFLRLRFDPNPGGDFITEINNCALIREVHVYGSSLGVGTEAVGSQHRGFGKLLVKTAEEISSMNGWKKTAVIAGVGTREYYKNKCGYHLGTNYMLKELTPYNYQESYRLGILINILVVIAAIATIYFI
jgi:ELP3 family radical SAM enzyme/protein acetyltransferase